jgi:hypothetical protein
MSEFSDCYFLRSREGADAGALLKRARRFGFILAESGMRAASPPRWLSRIAM